MKDKFFWLIFISVALSGFSGGLSFALVFGERCEVCKVCERNTD